MHSPFYLRLSLFVTLGLMLTAGFWQRNGVSVAAARSNSNGTPEWAPIGPEGGEVYAVSVSPHDDQLVIARSRAGISRSTDGGVSWTLVLDFFDRSDMSAAAFDPFDPQHIMVSRHNRLRESWDGGATWEWLDTKFYGSAVEFHPTIENTLIAYNTDLLYRSDNGGSTWAPVNTIYGYQPHIIIDPTAPNNWYETTRNGTFYSDDGGVTWDTLNKTGLYLAGLDPVSHTLYGYASYIDGPLRSTDGGQTWDAITNGLPAEPAADLVLDSATSGTIYVLMQSGNVYRSANSGDVWTLLYAEDAASVHGMELAISPTTPTILFRSIQNDPTGAGLYRSIDTGATWSPSVEGLSAIDVRDVDVIPGTPDKLYVLSEYRIYRSEDAGASWTTLPLTLSNDIYLSELAVDPTDSDIVWVAGSPFGILRSDDGGMTWEPRNDGILVDGAFSIAIAPTDPSLMVAGANGNTDNTYRSTNGGETWTQVSEDRAVDVHFNPADASDVWRRSHQDTVYHSRDGGETWVRAEEDQTGLPEDFNAYALAFGKDGTFYAGRPGFGTLYATANRGATWELLTPDDTLGLHVCGIVSDPVVSDTLYVSFNVVYYPYPQSIIWEGYGIQVTRDGGDTWEPFNAGLTFDAVTHLEAGQTTLYAGTAGGGLYAINTVLEPTPTPTATMPPTATSTPTATMTPTTTSTQENRSLYLPVVKR